MKQMIYHKKTSLESPFDLNPMLKGTKPPKDVHDVSNSRYWFSGKAKRSRLYTNSYLIGKKDYTVMCTNNLNRTLDIRCLKKNTILKDVIVNPGKTVYFGVETNNVKTKWHMLFFAPSDFDGQVR